MSDASGTKQEKVTGKPADDLVIEEYKACRELIKTNIDNIERNETYCVGAAAVTASFCFSASNLNVLKAASLLPAVITIIGLLRYFAFHMAIQTIDDYLRTVEVRTPPLNWATFYRARRDEQGFFSLHRARLFVWGVLLLLSIGLGLGVFIKGKNAVSGDPKPALFGN